MMDSVEFLRGATHLCRHGVLALALPSLACGSDAAPAAGLGSAEGVVAPSALVAAAASTNTPMVPVSGLVAASASAAPSAVPAVPEGASPAPTKDEWAVAHEVNTGDPRWHPSQCSLRMVREWLRLSCAEMLSYFHESNWGTAGTDYFDQKDGRGVLVIRMRKGEVIRARAGYVGRPEPFLLVAWPSGDSRPALISLEARPGAAQLGPPPGEPQPIPAMPTNATDRPMEADWYNGVWVNTAPSAARPPGCSMRLLRDWLKIRCDAQGDRIPGFMQPEGFGALKVDYFVLQRHDFVEVEVRLSPGSTRQARIDWDMGLAGRSLLRVEWPSGQPRPTVVALETSR